MTDAEWAVVRDAMPVPAWLEGRGGRPEGYCHRQLVDAVRYLVAGGITWRAMPADFPAWDRVYAFFRRWRDQGLAAEFHDRLRDRVREAAGRDPEPTAGIIDAQSVKAAASVPAASRGFDGGKKVNGRKRHIVVDTLGLLLTVLVTAACVTDREAGPTLLERLRQRHASAASSGPPSPRRSTTRTVTGCWSSSRRLHAGPARRSGSGRSGSGAVRPAPAAGRSSPTSGGPNRTRPTPGTTTGCAPTAATPPSTPARRPSASGPPPKPQRPRPSAPAPGGAGPDRSAAPHRRAADLRWGV
ncbi:IS5 family transposase [Streptomyces sp. NRRL S-495]|uniref:IS5 family transposase n=1 Tax=Streptomyces sp. NRRL S-495 TaxID=1609133 RepID=UPI000AA8351A|nr:IS5 family transposase [Streptomyces sp. NRRL S-495]